MEDNIDPTKYPRTTNPRTPYNLTSMYTSIKRSYELMEEYVKMTGIKYDFVVRYRYDGIIDFFPNLYLLPKDRIYYSNIVRHCGAVHNNSCIVPYDYAKQVFCAVDNLDVLYNKGAIFNDEQMCWANLCYNNLIDRMVKLPRNVYHVDCFRPGKLDIINRRHDITNNIIKEYHGLTTYN